MCLDSSGSGSGCSVFALLSVSRLLLQGGGSEQTTPAIRGRLSKTERGGGSDCRFRTDDEMSGEGKRILFNDKSPQ